mgnify:CR=1 FL=1
MASHAGNFRFHGWILTFGMRCFVNFVTINACLGNLAMRVMAVCAFCWRRNFSNEACIVQVCATKINIVDNGRAKQVVRGGHMAFFA